MSDRQDEIEARRTGMRSAAGPDAVVMIAAGLADHDWRVRKEAAAAAGRQADDPAMIALLADALLQPDDVGLRNAAIEAFSYVGPRGARALVDALERAPVTARKFVCAALGGTGIEGVPALASMARDPDPNTATVALESLARIGGPGAEESLRDRLAAEDWVVRLAALEGLAQLGARVPVATLAPMVDDALVRVFALRLLGHSGDAAAVAPLAKTLRGATSSAELAEIVLALGTVLDATPGAEEAIATAAHALDASVRESLRALVSGEDPSASRAAARLLAIARDVESLPAIAALAATIELGPGVLDALRGFGSGAVRSLLAASSSLEPLARAWAIEVSAELAAVTEEGAPIDEELGREVRDVLRAALEAREEVVVRAAVRGLSYWAEPGDASMLLRLGTEHGGAVARAAGNALEALSHSAPRSVEIALDDALPDAAEGWSSAIAALPQEAALEKLRAAISSGVPSARRAALLALDRVDGLEAAEIASVALADEDVDVQVAAVTVLARMQAAPAREIAARTLRVALREESPAVRAAAARALGALGDVEMRGAVRELLRDPGPGVALAALGALRALGGAGRASEPDLEELLLDVLGHPDDEVVKEGLLAVADGHVERKEARLAIGLAHPAWDVRRLAATLLGALGSADAQAKLREREPIETDDLVRIAIADALAGEVGA